MFRTARKIRDIVFRVMTVGREIVVNAEVTARKIMAVRLMEFVMPVSRVNTGRIATKTVQVTVLMAVIELPGSVLDVKRDGMDIVVIVLVYVNQMAARHPQAGVLNVKMVTGKRSAPKNVPRTVMIQDAIDTTVLVKNANLVGSLRVVSVYAVATVMIKDVI